jgi:integrase
MNSKKHFAFSRANLRALPPSEHGWTNVYDAAVRGLALGVSPTGMKSFLVYRKFKGRPVKIILGTFDPELPETREIPAETDPLEFLGNRASLNVRMARRIAAAVNVKLDSGVDPTISVKNARQELTLKQLFDAYFANLESRGKKSRHQFKWTFERYLGQLPDEPTKKHGRKRSKSEGAVNWSRRPLSTITRADIQKLRFDLAKEVGPTTSNRVVELLRAMYFFGIEEELYGGKNPAENLEKFHINSRDRYLQADELPTFFNALENESDEDIRDFFELALYTGARRGNLLGMRWEQVNLNSPSWRIPETKNGEPMTVPLVEEAAEILTRRAQDAQSLEWVFPGPGKSGHLENVGKAWNRILKRAGLSDLRIHDLRRSLGSWMASTGANMVMTQRALGHKTIAASLIYQRMAQDPVRAAMQRAASELNVLAKKQRAKVTEICVVPSRTGT